MTAREIRAALEDAKRTGLLPLVEGRDLHVLHREARRMGLAIEVQQIARETNDCMRVAVSKAYGIDYAELPDVDPLSVTPEAWTAAWTKWAERRGMRWWFSNELAPVGARRWIASVNSHQVAGASHAIPMEYDRVLPSVQPPRSS
jgi:hypothetical protein